MKRRWREELQLPATIKRNFLSTVAINDKNCSSDIRSFDSFRSKLFAKVISRFKSFLLNEYDLWILSSVLLMEIFDLRVKELKYAKNCFWIISENPYKILWGAGHVGRVKTVVTNHLRKMFHSRIHMAAERNTAARIYWDKLTETNS